MPAKGKKGKREGKTRLVKTEARQMDKEESQAESKSSPPTKQASEKKISSYFPISPPPTKPSTKDSLTPNTAAVTEEPKISERTLDSTKQANINQNSNDSTVTVPTFQEKTLIENNPLASSSDVVIPKALHGEEEKSGGSTEGNKDTVASPLMKLLSSPGDGSTAVLKTRRKKKKGTNKETKTDVNKKQTTVTEHFVVRRSQRKCKSTVEEEKRKQIEEAILSEKEEGVEVKHVEGKGRGVFAVQPFNRGDFVCEYAGELIDFDTAQEREKVYSENSEVGCYMYYFCFNNKKYCVDATKESNRLGRLLNHSVHGNCTTKLTCITDRPYLMLVAARNVKPGEELQYDYGERNKGIIESHPWLKA